MATNHIPRLLRLARRTGDRLIVTDEAGGGEPMVILPLEEYEALIDQAFGPSSFAEASEDEGEVPVGSPSLRRRGSGGGEYENYEEEEADPLIELSDEIIAEIAEETPEEADIDEEALKSLWQAPVEVEVNKEEEKIVEKPQEVVKKKSSKADGGEEGFYLEAID